MANTDTSLRLRQLCVYPVKSLRGILVQEWPLDARGLAWDRHWMLVMPNGGFVSQRQLPRMALIDTAIADGELRLSMNGHGSVTLPLQGDPTGEEFDAKVWRDPCRVEPVSESASAWLNRVLQPRQPLRLVRMAQGFRRRHVQPQRFGPETHTRFADASPCLVTNQASLERLNRHLQGRQLAPVDMRRFRPNLVIDGLPAFAEHHYRLLEHVDTGLHVRLVDPCQRCVVTTIDPDSASADPGREPFASLVDLNPMPGNPRAPAFGVNAVPLGDPATLRVGDRLRLSERSQ